MSVAVMRSERGWGQENASPAPAGPRAGHSGYCPGPGGPGVGAHVRGCRAPAPALACARVGGAGEQEAEEGRGQG